MHDMNRQGVSVNWPILRGALYKHFRQSETDADVTRMLNVRKMSANEKFEDYYEEIMRIHDKLSNPKSSEELISIIKRNVCNRLFSVVYSIHSTDLDHFRHDVLRAEYDLEHRFPNHFSKQQFVPKSSNNSNFPPKKVAELDIDPISTFFTASNNQPEFEVDEMRYKIDTENILCGNCRQKGHK